jgi:hypothetical protein
LGGSTFVITGEFEEEAGEGEVCECAGLQKSAKVVASKNGLVRVTILSRKSGVNYFGGCAAKY